MPELLDITNLLNNNYALNIERAEFFRDGGSLSYVVYTGTAKCFLRVIRPPFTETALQSIDIHLYLQSNRFPVPQIILTKAGTPYVNVDEQDNKGLYVLYEYIEGRETDEDFEKIGSLVGQFHNVMQGYKGPLKVRDKHFFIGRYIDILKKKGYPDSKTAAYQEYGDALWEKVKNLPRGYCHGDLYRGNVHQAETGERYILDFDTSCNAFPVNDIVFVCNSTHYFDFDESGYEKTKKAVEHFLRGYLPYRALSEAEASAIYDLVAVMHYQLQATIIELYGLDCVDEEFIDKQLDWLMKWRAQCEASL